VRATYVFVALILTGCGLSPEYRARMEAQRAAAAAAIQQADDATCRGYGVPPGSQGYVACRMNLANNRTTAQAIAEINEQRESEALLAAGTALLQQKH
jgi:hypothetical protein